MDEEGQDGCESAPFGRSAPMSSPNSVTPNVKTRGSPHQDTRRHPLRLDPEVTAQSIHGSPEFFDSPGARPTGSLLRNTHRLPHRLNPEVDDGSHSRSPVLFANDPPRELVGLTRRQPTAVKCASERGQAHQGRGRKGGLLRAWIRPRNLWLRRGSWWRQWC